MNPKRKKTPRPYVYRLFDQYGVRETSWFIRDNNECAVVGTVWLKSKELRKLANWLIKAADYLEEQT